MHSSGNEGVGGYPCCCTDDVLMRNDLIKGQTDGAISLLYTGRFVSGMHL